MLSFKRLAKCRTRGGSQGMYMTFTSAMWIRQNPLWLWNPEKTSYEIQNRGTSDPKIRRVNVSAPKKTLKRKRKKDTGCIIQIAGRSPRIRPSIRRVLTFIKWLQVKKIYTHNIDLQLYSLITNDFCAPWDEFNAIICQTLINNIKREKEGNFIQSLLWWFTLKNVASGSGSYRWNHAYISKLTLYIHDKKYQNNVINQWQLLIENLVLTKSMHFQIFSAIEYSPSSKQNKDENIERQWDEVELIFSIKRRRIVHW